MTFLTTPISALGKHIRQSLIALGAFTRLFFALLARSSIIFTRPRLVIQQIHFIGILDEKLWLLYSSGSQVK